MFSLRLKEIKKHGDILVRYSGDEFLLVRYDIKKEQMTQLVENVLELLSEPFTIRGLSVVLGISIGAASYPNDGGDFNETKKYADMALQEAKKEKNCYRFFEESIKQKHLRVSMIERELKTALDNDEIYMVYQPQIKSDGTIYGVEALVRWENRLLGFVAPDEFIQIAESTGVMVKLGRYIINRSLKEASEVQKRREAEFRLSINISVKQFKESNFYENLLESIEERGFTKSLLTLEITESLFIENKNEVLSLLGKIRAQGIKISLDDFGTGYSSLSLLRKLPVDELKIDKSFIDDLGHNLDAASIVRLIILISMQLGIGLVAEGVERVEQKDILRGYGCDFYQGYYFSKPLKKDDLLDFLR
jgi:EAL domain-containing protein (putative c-di-GMP-specific phosphodiesterase class I)